jgi:hypothetical protein
MSNEQQLKQEDNNDSTLLTMEEFVQRLKQGIAKWTPEEKAQARQVLMDKYVNKEQN